ncbi:slit homolog 2 protein-like [Anoplophora glabripennis]|uniref:slit homolog 2 protein-like n=1 Tax=Anoplophora glabripennis TaxID=217634 RepID=UPI0008752F27|nr:slit homolog 2 protein-like [Anoplophora glabripennis]
MELKPKHLLVTLLLCFLFKKCRPLCQVQTDPNLGIRTMCTLSKISEGEPLDFELKEPPYLYLTVDEGEIPENTFEHVRPTKELWFIGVNITYIQPGAFKHLATLKSLAVSNTSVETLSKNTFEGLQTLKTLALGNNKIKTIEDGAFLGLTNLDQLILDDNRITRLEEKTFDGLKFLRGLFLNNNPIEYIHDSALQNVKELTHLTISIVQGKNVSERALQLPRVFQLRIFYLVE